MSDDAFNRMMVVGGGAWGTALATLLADTGKPTTIWAREAEVVDSINTAHENSLFLPGVALSKNLSATGTLEDARTTEALLFVVPAQFARATLSVLREVVGMAAMPVALCCKGIERDTGKLMTDVLGEAWPEAIPAVLSGPSFAADVARGLPTAVTLACSDPALGQRWLCSISARNFRPYLSDDLIGAELGGSVKNVLAIACGIVEGRGLGESARAALMARGFAEFQRFGMAMGAKAQTMAGLSGLGDLILTCSSRQSRNMSLGYEIGQGRRASEIIAGRQSVSEGAATARPLSDLAASLGIEMPVSTAVADLIDEKLSVDRVIEDLMSRPLTEE